MLAHRRDSTTPGRQASGSLPEPKARGGQPLRNVEGRAGKPARAGLVARLTRKGLELATGITGAIGCFTTDMGRPSSWG